MRANTILSQIYVPRLKYEQDSMNFPNVLMFQCLNKILTLHLGLLSVAYPSLAGVYKRLGNVGKMCGLEHTKPAEELKGRILLFWQQVSLNCCSACF